MTQSLDTTLKECRENCLNDFLAQTLATLNAQSFTLPEIIDALANYTYINTNCVDAVLLLSEASLSLKIQ